jgi:SAM-dependent methyltransferase
MLETLDKLLVCPNCKSKLRRENNNYTCLEPRCSATYPIVRDIPVLIDDRISTFRQSAYSDACNGKNHTRRSLRKRMRAITPRISANLVAHKNFAEFGRLLLEGTDSPRVLILGGAEIGAGLRGLLEDRRFEFIETDVAMGPRTQLVCDASYLPFDDQSVDGVISQAVLEYIPDPALCVQEIYRVLKVKGIVYSEMPFMQDVHGGRYDFTRLTHLGHRRLFRRFAEISSGACAGPATALAWSIQHFFMALGSAPLRDPIKFVMGSTLFWLKYFDYVLAQRPAGLDAATGTYLLARKSDAVLNDEELLASYRGAVPRSGII